MPALNPAISDGRRELLARQGAALARARAARKLSQPAAAAALGVPLATYRSWEHGKRQPPAATRARLVKEWGVAAEDLALGAGERCPECGRRY